MLFTSLAIALAAASSAHAHGYVQDVKVSGKSYPAWHPFEDPYASPVPKTVQRKVADDGPVNFDAAELTCNKGGNKGNGASATIAAGQTVKWTMNRWPEDHHGPISVYMADCNGDCNSFSGSGKSWFKLSSAGLIDAKSFKWASDKLIADGNSWTATVPSNIKAGNYLMRLELLALHSAGQPQLYPSCTQLKVTGGGDGAPTNAELVSIPGVYKSGDPALFGDIWGSPKSWPQVGPNVAAFISGGSSDPAPPAPAPPKASDPAPSPSSKPTSKYPEAQPEPATTSKTASGSAPTKSSKVCRHKTKALTSKSGHSAKRNYVRGLGKNRL